MLYSLQVCKAKYYHIIYFSLTTAINNGYSSHKLTYVFLEHETTDEDANLIENI